jgi:hypothetical protein
MPRVLELSDEDLERCVVHELVHVFLNEARENGEDWLDHEERVASTLAQAFIWLRDHARESVSANIASTTTANTVNGAVLHPVGSG